MGDAVAEERTGMKVGEFQVARCDYCGGDVVFKDWPAGWSQSGGSGYGDKYSPECFAWICPACRIENPK